MHGSVDDWPKFFDEAYNALTPGGWYESVELELGIFSENYENGVMPEDNVLRRWYNLGAEAGYKSGRRLDVAGTVKDLMLRRGFTEVTERAFKIPVSLSACVRVFCGGVNSGNRKKSGKGRKRFHATNLGRTKGPTS